eukprot:TRINITY_DN60929_c0_g1_i1.p1 TRINITY_DN60929_c0_g1~~TRINITY_DN60929_c0_g1_i1.p1  ORF type:complete len:412 (-),score=105.27 TRINITY_DN60929_c0_g1_i1:45-1280(-)
MAAEEDSTDNYRIKDITFFGSRRKILLQSKNGPCPLLAICNVLLLRNTLKINPDARYITFHELVELLSDLLFEVNSAAQGNGGDSTSSRAANLRESLSSCLEILPKLNVGMDVNCKFGGVTDFEYTQETTVFDLLDIALYHGWIVSKESSAYEIFGHLSYNQVVERLIAYGDAQLKLSAADGGDGAAGEAPDAEVQKVLEEGLVIQDFLDRTASQLSYDGLMALHESVRERQLAVFFRNSHFNAMIKYEGTLYLLCTDIAFSSSHLLWERFSEVDGDTEYCDANFRTSAEGGGDLSAEDAAAIAVAEAEAAALGEGPPEGDADAQLAWQIMQDDLRAQEEAVYAQAQANAKAKAKSQAQAQVKAKAKVQPQPAQPGPEPGPGPGESKPASQQASSAGSDKKKKSGKSCTIQ